MKIERVILILLFVLAAVVPVSARERTRETRPKRETKTETTPKKETTPRNERPTYFALLDKAFAAFKERKRDTLAKVLHDDMKFHIEKDKLDGILDVIDENILKKGLYNGWDHIYTKRYTPRVHRVYCAFYTDTANVLRWDFVKIEGEWRLRGVDVENGFEALAKKTDFIFRGTGLPEHEGSSREHLEKEQPEYYPLLNEALEAFEEKTADRFEKILRGKFSFALPPEKLDPTLRGLEEKILSKGEYSGWDHVYTKKYTPRIHVVYCFVYTSRVNLLQFRLFKWKGTWRLVSISMSNECDDIDGELEFIFRGSGRERKTGTDAAEPPPYLPRLGMVMSAFEQESPKVFPQMLRYFLNYHAPPGSGADRTLMAIHAAVRKAGGSTGWTPVFTKGYSPRVHRVYAALNAGQWFLTVWDLYEFRKKWVLRKFKITACNSEETAPYLDFLYNEN